MTETGSRTRSEDFHKVADRLTDAARILTTPDVAMIVATVRGTAPSATVNMALTHLMEHKALRKVRRGLYMNMTLVPRVQPVEATGHVRKGAIVSLHTVLGERVLNNYPRDVWAVIPQGHDASTSNLSSGRPKRDDPDLPVFEFKVMDARVLLAPASEDLFDPRFSYRRATPEAALVHWAYLSAAAKALNNGRGMSEPPLHDVDFTELDEDRLFRIAGAMGMAKSMGQWLKRRSEHDHGDDQFSPGLGF